MSLPHHRPGTIALILALALALFDSPIPAQQPKTLHGRIEDPTGAAVAGAAIELFEATHALASTTSAPDGSFRFSLPASGRYSLRVAASTFETTTTPPTYLTGSASDAIDIILNTRTLTQQVTVTATGNPTPQAQTGVSVSVLTPEDYPLMPEIQQPLRLIPGVQVTQVGQTGSATSLFIRGGDSDSTKVLLDGVPANQVGGSVDLASLTTVGVQSIEVLRDPNSALYGSDALAGVVSLTTARGTTPLPLLTYAGDAGNFGTYRNEVTAGTAFRQFDLFSAFARIDTRNNLPGSTFHNATYSGNFGWTPNPANDLRFSLRHIVLSAGQPNALAFYGIPDDVQQKQANNFYSAAWNNQTTARWHNQVRYGGLRLASQFNSFGATGIPDPNSGLFDGAPVTITGANGYSVTGQAVFQYSADPSQYLGKTDRDFVYAQTDYRLNPHALVLGAFKYENESGSSGSAGSPITPVDRRNSSYTVQVTGDFRDRLFYTLGTGLEDNELFGFAGTPRASLAFYLFRPSGNGLFTGTKLRGNFGKGIKEPGIYQEQNSLFGTLAALPNGASLISRFNVRPLGPENSRSYDAGLDQQLLNGRIRVGITYFHNQFTNRVEYVPQAGLVTLGVPAANLPAFDQGGAYLNSSAFRSQGLELESEGKLGSHLFLRAGYTYTDAVVQRSFSSDNLGPSFNTASSFPDVPIGAFSPLDGARPFRIAPHTGYFALGYTRSKFFGTLTGTLVSRRDDSDYLYDTNFGGSLLLPNRNLLGSYQRLELGGGYKLARRVDLYTNIQNLLSEHFFEAFGYPALPLTVRTGLKFSFGGESWKLN